MTEFNTIMSAWITVFALAIFVVSIVAYMRTKSNRVLLVSIAFALFFAKGVFLSVYVFYNFDFFSMLILLDTLIILLLAISILKK